MIVFRQLLLFSMAEFIDDELKRRLGEVVTKYNPEWKCFGMSASKKGPTFTLCDVCYTDWTQHE